MFVQTGVTREIFATTRNREVAKFVGKDNLLDGF